jgi:hypothetical protein
LTYESVCGYQVDRKYRKEHRHGKDFKGSLHKRVKGRGGKVNNI